MGYFFKIIKFFKNWRNEIRLKRSINIGYYFFILFFASCSFLEKSTLVKQTLVIEKKWVRDSRDEDKLGPRLFQNMRPTIVGEKIIQGNAHDSLVIYNRSNGDKLWSLKLKYGVASGIAVHKNAVYFGASDGRFYKLDIKSGGIHWAFPVRAETLSQPYISEGVVYFVSGNNVLYALDAESGRLVWQKTHRTVKNLLIRGGSSPVVFKGYIIVGFSNGELVSLNKKTRQIVWKRQLSHSKRFPDIVVPPVVDGKYIYIGSYDDSLYKIQASNGEIIWEINYGISNAVTIVGNRLFVSTTDGRVLSLDKKFGKTLWSKNLKNGIGTQPVFFNEMLFLGESEGSLIAMNADTGEIVTRFRFGRGMTASPLIDKKTGDLYIQSNEGYLYALQVYWEKVQNSYPWSKRKKL